MFCFLLLAPTVMHSMADWCCQGFLISLNFQLLELLLQMVNLGTTQSAGTTHVHYQGRLTLLHY